MKVVTTPTNGTTPIDSRASNRIRVAIISATLLGLLIAAFCSYHKLPWSDEGWFSSPAYNLAKHGTFGSTVIEPATSGLTRIQQRTYWVAPLYLLGQAAWYLVFPPSIFLTRVF